MKFSHKKNKKHPFRILFTREEAVAFVHLINRVADDSGVPVYTINDIRCARLIMEVLDKA